MMAASVPRNTATMKFVILAALAAVALAKPVYDDSHSLESREHIPILKDERVHEDDGRFSMDMETGNGISFSKSGSPDGPEGTVVMSGVYSYTAPDGTPVEVKFVADEGGYQPDSALLPVAPAFPHPIPQFVLDQIAKAAREDAERSSEEGYSYA